MTMITAWVLTSNSFSEPRTFINRDGKKIVAEIIRVEKEFVILRKGARDFRTAISLFSDTDQQFIREWAENNIVYKFDVRASKEKTGKSGAKRNAGYQITEDWRYKLEITNRGFSEVGPLTARYLVVADVKKTVRGRLRTRDNRKSESTVQSQGEFTLPALGATRAFAFETSPLPLNQEKKVVETVTDFDSNNRPLYSSTTFRTNSSLAGFWIKLYNQNGKVVFEHKSKYPRWDNIAWNPTAKK